jgi:hypothetical protein
MKTLTLRVLLALKQHRFNRLSWQILRAERRQERLTMECKELADKIARRLQAEGYKGLLKCK